jgi:hypothetical protein
MAACVGTDGPPGRPRLRGVAERARDEGEGAGRADTDGAADLATSERDR